MRTSVTVRLGCPVACVVLALLLGACGSSSGSPSGTSKQSAGGYDLTIGDMLQLTGSGAAFGPPYKRAAELALQQIDKAIKANKLDIHVKLAHADNETTPQGAVAAGQQLIAQGASCIAGPNTSDAVLAVAQAVVFPQQVPEIVNGASSDAITDLDRHGLLYRLFPADQLQAKLLAQVISQRLHGASGNLLAVAGANTAFGKEFAAELAQDWKDIGGKVAGPVIYDPEALSYNSEAQQLTTGSPKAYVILDEIGGPSFARMGNALLRTGRFDASKLFVGGGQPAEAPSSVPKRAIEGAEGLRPSAPTASKAYQAFLKLYRASPNPPELQVFTQNNFDAVIMCFLGSVKANSADGTAIARELRGISGPPGKTYTWRQLPAAVAALSRGEDINYEGVSGDIDWNSNGDVQASVWDLYRYEDGAQKTVKSVTTDASQ